MTLLIRRKRDKARNGRERWVGRCSITSAPVRYLWHQCSDATAEKKIQFLLNMHVCPLLAQSTMGRYCLLRRVKLAGWVLLLPHPVQDQKNERCLPMQLVPTALAKSASLSSGNQRDLLLSISQTLFLNHPLSLLPVAFQSPCPFLGFFLIFF